MAGFALFFRGDKGIFCGKLAGMVSEGVHRYYSLSKYIIISTKAKLLDSKSK